MRLKTNKGLKFQFHSRMILEKDSYIPHEMRGLDWNARDECPLAS